MNPPAHRRRAATYGRSEPVAQIARTFLQAAIGPLGGPGVPIAVKRQATAAAKSQRVACFELFHALIDRAGIGDVAEGEKVLDRAGIDGLVSAGGDGR